MASKIFLTSLLGVLVIAVICSTLLIFHNKQEPNTLENPFILEANAQLGQSLTMHITGIEGISPTETITLNSAELHDECAVVVGKSGEEIFTDKYGRVKVQLHLDKEDKVDSDSSCWIRVTLPWAGKNWGLVSTPRIGQEVVVDFLEGDPDKPIIVGKVYGDQIAFVPIDYKFTDQGPIMQAVILPKIIRWQFNDQNGNTFCGGVDTTKAEFLDCAQLLTPPNPPQ